jgi:cation-transporting ATPase 13A2
VFALAIRTGFTTLKGALVRSILLPKDCKFKFYIDAFKFLGIMSLIAICGFVGTIPTLLNSGI